MDIKHYFSISLLALAGVVAAQSIDYKSSTTKQGSNYYKVVSKARQQFKEKQQKGGDVNLSLKKQKKQFERWAYFWKDRVAEDGSFPNALDGWYNAGIIGEDGKIVNQPSERTTASVKSWENIGPKKVPEINGYTIFPQLGRVNTFLRYAHENESQDVLFVGAPSGGIWKSTDNGTTWTPKTDNIAGIGITDIKSSSTNIDVPGIIYASTGDYDAQNTNSIGVIKSTDFGENWESTNLSFTLDDKERLSNLIVIDANTVIVGTNSAIKKTTDGGDSWTDVASSIYGLNYGRFTRDNNQNIICTDVWGGVYFSNDLGDRWTEIQVSSDNSNHIATTIDLSDSTFYIQEENGAIKYYRPYEETPTLETLLEEFPGYNSQGGYNQALVVHKDMLISTAVNGYVLAGDKDEFFKGLNGYWGGEDTSGSYVHPDHHAIGALNDDYSFYNCNDGGLSYINFTDTNDTKPTITYKSSGVLVTQVYTVAITPQNEDYFMMGNQDNDGFSKEMHDGKVQWIAVQAGDGTCTAIDYSNPDIRYLGGVHGSLVRVDSGFSGNYEGNQLIGADDESFNFVWPLKLHSTIPSTLFIGADDIYKSTDKGENWDSLGSEAGLISFIETFDKNIVVIGADGVKKTDDEGSTWANVFQPSSSASVNSISLDQNTPTTIYATVNGYIDGEKVFKSTDNGDSWYNISDGLPNIVMKQVKLFQNQNENVLFLGTELGLYMKKNDSDWERYGEGLPNVIVNDLEINYTSEQLVIATFGRGLWQIDISEAAVGLDEDISNEKLSPIVLGNPILDGKVNIKIQDNHSYTYTIYNTVGGNIASGVFKQESNSVDVSSAPNGIYLVRMRNELNQVVTRKIVIKK